MNMLQSIARFFYPLFYGPFDVPGFPSPQSLHRMVIHFPIVLFALTWIADLFTATKKSKFLKEHSDVLYKLGFAALVLAYITGQISANRKGLSLRDPEWLSQNQELGGSVVNHRGLATIALVTFTVILLMRTRLLKRVQIKAQQRPWVNLGLMTAGFLLLSLTAHFGANLKL